MKNIFNLKHFLLLTILFFLPLMMMGCKRALTPSKSTSTNNPIITTTDNSINAETPFYNVVLEPETPPLKQGEDERLVLQVEDRTTHHPMTLPDIAVRISMTKPMEMGAPTSIHQMSVPGKYEIETNFQMSGHWIIEVTPKPSEEPIKVPITVNP